MEQIIQQISRKPPFLIKTKIAAWWMIVCGILGLIYSIYNFALVVAFILPILLTLLSGFFLLRRERWGWWLSVATLSMIIISPFLMFFTPIFISFYTFGAIIGFPFHILNLEGIINMFGSLIYLIPLTLLIIERKNFFKIAS